MYRIFIPQSAQVAKRTSPARKLGMQAQTSRRDEAGKRLNLPVKQSARAAMTLSDAQSWPGSLGCRRPPPNIQGLLCCTLCDLLIDSLQEPRGKAVLTNKKQVQKRLAAMANTWPAYPARLEYLAVGILTREAGKKFNKLPRRICPACLKCHWAGGIESTIPPVVLLVASSER